jgi:hypothetical protein
MTDDRDAKLANYAGQIVALMAERDAARQQRDELAAAMTELGTVLSSSAAAWERCVEAVEKARAT